MLRERWPGPGRFGGSRVTDYRVASLMREPSNYLSFRTPSEWRAWLEKNHAAEGEAWLVHYKKAANPGRLSYEDAVEEALCYGWIDGLLRSLDGDRFALRYTPRKRGSIWSEGNRRRAERLIQEGRMSEPGLQKVDEAKRNGQWEAALQRQDVDTLPADLLSALRRRKGATAAFKSLPSSRKSQYLWWLASAKRAETREKRLRAVIEAVAAASKR
jgi:uncharacterized protein YdeI (YjbR/CyaY-like superfamily)